MANTETEAGNSDQRTTASTKTIEAENRSDSQPSFTTTTTDTKTTANTSQLLNEACRKLLGSNTDFSRTILPIFSKNLSCKDGVAASVFFSSLLCILTNSPPLVQWDGSDSNDLDKFVLDPLFGDDDATTVIGNDAVGTIIHVRHDHVESNSKTSFDASLSIAETTIDAFYDNHENTAAAEVNCASRPGEDGTDTDKNDRENGIHGPSSATKEESSARLLEGIATDLASLQLYLSTIQLEEQGCGGTDNAVANSNKVTSVTTASDLMKQCVTQLYSKEAMTIINELIQKQLEGNKMDGTFKETKSGDAKSQQEQLRNTLRTYLQTMITECELIKGLLQDLGFLWNKSCESFSNMDADAKKCAWMLHSVVDVARRGEFQSKDFQTSDGDRTLELAACVVLVAKAATIYDDDHEMSKDEDELHPEAKKRKTSPEDEAIAALSMMPTTGSSPPSTPIPNLVDIISICINCTSEELTREMDNISTFVKEYMSPNTALEQSGGSKYSSIPTKLVFFPKQINASPTINKKRNLTKDDSILSNASNPMAPFFCSAQARNENYLKLKSIYQLLTKQASSSSINAIILHQTQFKMFPSIVTLAVDHIKLYEDSNIVDALARIKGCPLIMHPTQAKEEKFPTPLVSDQPMPIPRTIVSTSSNQSYHQAKQPPNTSRYTHHTSMPQSSLLDEVDAKHTSSEHQHNTHMSTPASQKYSHSLTKSISATRIRQPPSSIAFSPILNNPRVAAHVNSANGVNYDNSFNSSFSTMTDTPIPYSPPLPLSNSLSLDDWITRLYSDPTLAKPSETLLNHFDSSDRSSSSNLHMRNSSPSGSLLSNIISVLNNVLQEVVKCVQPYDMNEHDYNIDLPFNLLDNGELVVRSQNPPFHDIHHQPSPTNFQEKVTYNVIKSLTSLYYNSLESILTEETRRLSSNNHSKLLSTEVFLRALLASCAGCVFYCFRTPLSIRDILKMTQTDPFQFLKINELFVRALTKSSETSHHDGLFGDDISYHHHANPLGLPQEVQRHLQFCEEQVLESLLWISEPSGYGYFPAGAMVNAVLSLQDEATKSNSNELWPPQAWRSSRETTGRTNHNVIAKFTKGSRNIPPRFRQKFISVSFVARKLLPLSARRIADICEKLNLIPPVIERIWKVWLHFLCHHIRLLFDRDIDQFILCTIYGVCKSVQYKPEVKFRDNIIDIYRKLYKSRGIVLSKILSRVRLNCPYDPPKKDNTMNAGHGHVIRLHNEVFVPVMTYAIQEECSEFDFLQHQQEQAKKEIRNVHDAINYADKISSGNSHAIPSLFKGLPKCMVCAINSVTPTRIDNSNLVVSTCTVPKSDRDGAFLQGRLGYSQADRLLTPRTRAFYTFGESAKSDLTLVNNTVQGELHLITEV